PNDPVAPVTRIEDPLISDTLKLPGGVQEGGTRRKHNHDPLAFQARWKTTTPVQLEFNHDWSWRPEPCKKVGVLCPPLACPILEQPVTELQRLREAFRTALDLPADAPVDDLHYQD